MRTPSLKEQVAIYCRKAKGNKKLLASALGYKTPDTISVWLKANGKVPEFRKEEVKAKLASLKA